MFVVSTINPDLTWSLNSESRCRRVDCRWEWGAPMPYMTREKHRTITGGQATLNFSLHHQQAVTHVSMVVWSIDWLLLL
jgi:hypothetical protein